MTENERKRLYSLIGERVRRYREGRDLTQETLAEQVSISRASIVNIEKGRQRPPVHVLWDIAEKLGIEAADLIPDQVELADATPEAPLDENILSLIDEASEGDQAVKRRLVEFIRSVKADGGQPRQ